jgi:hypothetical protein
LSEDEEIQQIKKNFMTTVDPESRKMASDSLARHGKKGISLIRELINIIVNDEVKKHGFEVIKQAESNVNTERPWQIEGDVSSDEDEDAII